MRYWAAGRHKNTPTRSGSLTSIGEFIFFSNLLYRGQLLAQESKSNCNLKTATMFDFEVGDGHKGTSMNSLYDVLGVSSRANETAIRTAFRKAAKSYHPDLNAGNPTAELQFRQIVAAYELLKDPLQREAYDQQLKDDRRARTRRIASPLISGVVSGGLVALAMWWFNNTYNNATEPVQAPRVAV